MIGPTPAPTARPRPSGGFSQGLGNFADEHLNEAAMQQAMQQKTLQQQQTSTSPQSGKSGANPLVPPQQNEQPREVGSLTEELIKRPAGDIIKGLKSLFSINTLLGLNVTDTPEEQAKKQQFHQRYQQMSEAEQKEAQKRYQMEMQKKKHEREEEEMRKQQQQQAAKRSIATPSGTKKGPVGPASGKSKKSNAMAMLDQDRKTMADTGKKF